MGLSSLITMPPMSFLLLSISVKADEEPEKKAKISRVSCNELLQVSVLIPELWTLMAYVVEIVYITTNTEVSVNY